MVGPIAQTFDLISSEYGWDDSIILDKTLRRIRQILAAILLRHYKKQKDERLLISWQTRSIAMVAANAGSNASEELMQFAANLTVDADELKRFSKEQKVSKPIKSKTPVHASTQDSAVQENFEAAADRNNFDMLAMFGMKVEQGPPG